MNYYNQCLGYYIDIQKVLYDIILRLKSKSKLEKHINAKSFYPNKIKIVDGETKEYVNLEILKPKPKIEKPISVEPFIYVN